jgi:SAM-dependent methyltransferase
MMDDSTVDIGSWNRIADQYTQIIGTPEDRINAAFKAVLWDSLGDLHGAQVLDVGCGHGWLAHAMLAAGATVTGIDGSTEMLANARQLCPQTEFIEWDLARGLPPLAGPFDRILANMVMMDLPDISALLKAVRQALPATGKFIFTLPHPCFFQQKSERDAATGQMFCRVTGYLQPEVWQIESFGGHRHYHRSLTDYFEALRANQLAVTRLYEPPQMAYTEANDDFRQKIPKFLLIEATPI